MLDLHNMTPFLTSKTFHIPHLRKSCQSTKTQDLTWSPKATWKFLNEENWSSWEKYPLSALRSEECVAQKWNPEGPSVQFSSVQSLSCVWLFATPWTAAHQASLSITNSRACSNSRPLSQWCHPTISFSVIVPFSSHLQSSPASGSFQMSQFFASGGQRIRVSA